MRRIAPERFSNFLGRFAPEAILSIVSFEVKVALGRVASELFSGIRHAESQGRFQDVVRSDSTYRRTPDPVGDIPIPSVGRWGKRMLKGLPLAASVRAARASRLIVAILQHREA